MNLRTYRARTMGDCLAEVKKDLGKDAVILHTRTFKVGGVLGLGAKPMVEVTASQGGPESPRRRSGNIAALKAYSAPAASPRDQAAFKPLVDRAAGNAATRNEGSVAVAAPPEPEPPVVVTVPQRMPVVRTGPANLESPTARSTVPAVESQGPSRLGDEIASLRKMMGQVLQCSRHTAMRIGRESGNGFTPAAIPDAMFDLYAKLLERDVSPDLADEVISRAREAVAVERLDDVPFVRTAVIRSLAGLISTEPEHSPAIDGRPLTLALVGPTGVGKTTTVAKLAATYKLRHNKRVGLVTSDTYRIAAVDQLRTYAEIIGLPLKIAMSPADMASSCHSLSDCDIILIDTAGRSPRDGGRLEELSSFIAAARPHQTHLVLSSVASESGMLDAATRFQAISPDRVIFTKLDEAVNFGVMITVAHRISLRLSYITTGQEVPDHIEAARPERIAELVLGDSGGGGLLR